MSIPTGDSNHGPTRLISLVLASAAAGSVLAFGGVEATAFVPVQIAVAILALVVFWQHGSPRISLSTSSVLAILLAVPLLQLIPMPRSLVSAVSPARVALADNLPAGVTGFQKDMALTVNSYETLIALLRFVCYLLVFLLAVRSYQQGGDQKGLVSALIGIGLFEALYGTVQYLTGWQYIFHYKKMFYVQEATGTYINRNHYAGLLEMVLPFVVAGILLRARLHDSDRQTFWRRLIISPHSSRILRDVILFAVLLVGLIFSRSRMGIMAAVLGIALTAAIVFLQGHRSALIVLLFVLAFATVYATWIGLAPVIERFEVLGEPGAFEEDRLPLWRDTLALIHDFPLVGTGLGTFSWASMHYQSTFLNMRYGHAHSDYLEFAADFGIPAAILFWVSLWSLLVKVARQALRLERTNDRVLAAGCAGAMASLLIHSITDFNLQVPANAFLFSWIAGTAAALVRKT